MNEENKNNSEASTDTKDTYNEIANNEKIQNELLADEAAAAAPADDTQSPSAPPVGISLASMQVKLEALPEVEQLTAELLDEAKNPSAAPERGKKVKKTERKKSDKVSPPKTQMVEMVEEAPKPEQEEELSLCQADEAEPASEIETKGEADREIDAANKPARRPRTKKIVLTVLLSVFAVALVLVGIEAVRLMHIFNSVNYVKSGNSFSDTEMVVSQSAIAAYVSHSDETKNILLVGYDIDENDISRSDSMIILTLDHEHQKIKMTSLMRDMYVQIPGHGKHKLNAAFVYGGPELLLETIYANFGLQIDNYVCVDYAAFVDVVDYIGGVQVDIEEIELEQFNKYVRGGQKNKLDEAGSYIFNGQQALSYCRIRKVGTDTARTARQREVLGKIMQRCSRLSLFKLEHLLSITAPAVTTNLTQAQIFQLAAEGLDSMDYDMQGMRIPVDGAWWDENIGGTWYVAIDLNANARYLHDFIYGDDEIADELAANLAENDSAAEEREKASFERKKAQENKGNAE